MPKVAVLPKLFHPNRRWWRSASATLYAAKKVHTKSPSDMPSRIGSLNLFWRWSTKGSSFKSSAGKPQASTRHLWCNTLDKTTQHWIKHTVEFVDWQDLGTKNLIPNTCKSGEAALLKLQNWLPNLCCITGLEKIRNENNPCITMNHLEIESRQSEERPHGVAFVRLKVHPSFLHPYCRHAPALGQLSTSPMSLMARVHFYAHPPKCLREGRRLLPVLARCHPHFSER